MIIFLSVPINPNIIKIFNISYPTSFKPMIRIFNSFNLSILFFPNNINDSILFFSSFDILSLLLFSLLIILLLIIISFKYSLILLSSINSKKLKYIH